MAYDFMAESPHRLDWRALRDALVPGARWVEFFPIPAEEEGEKDGLGVSLPTKYDTPDSQGELRRLINYLRREWGMKVYDLNAGKEITPPD